MYECIPEIIGGAREKETGRNIAEHPNVAEAAVIVPESGTKPEADEILKFCKKRLAKFQMPKRLEFVSYLPKTPLGNVLKKELRKQYFGW